MITIPTTVKNELLTLDHDLQRLGRQLYGRKIYGDYSDGNHFQNFSLELHLNGMFTLHFRGGILGSIESREFGAKEALESVILNELEQFREIITHQMRLVNA